MNFYLFPRRKSGYKEARTLAFLCLYVYRYIYSFIYCKKEPRIGIIAKPCGEFVAGLWAIWLCHGIAVPLALSHPEAELLHVLTDSVNPYCCFSSTVIK